jgi:hypothetical protein
VLDLEGHGPAWFVAVRFPPDEELTPSLTRLIRRAAKVPARFDGAAETEDEFLVALQAAELDRRRGFPDSLKSHRHGVSLAGGSSLAPVKPLTRPRAERPFTGWARVG